MNKHLLILLLGFFLVTSLEANTPRKFGQVRTIDNFEDGTILDSPEWWRFGRLETKVVKEKDSSVPNYVGDYVLQLRGKTKHWYVGGVGVYMPMDATRYNFVKLIIKGYGEHSGSLVLELFDDDNNNAYIEHNEADPSYTLYDDKFIYTLKVNWSGWRVVMVPMHMFKDANPGIGDNIWNPTRTGKSGGFVQMQILALSSESYGAVEIDIDTIKLFYGR